MYAWGCTRACVSRVFLLFRKHRDFQVGLPCLSCPLPSGWHSSNRLFTRQTSERRPRAGLSGCLSLVKLDPGGHFQGHWQLAKSPVCHGRSWLHISFQPPSSTWGFHLLAGRQETKEREERGKTDEKEERAEKSSRSLDCGSPLLGRFLDLARLTALYSVSDDAPGAA